MSADGHFEVPKPVNEPVRSYAPGDPNRKSLKARLAELTDAKTQVPMQIGGERRWGASRADVRSPHRHELAIAEYAVGGAKDIDDAINAALSARKAWAATPYHERAAVLLRAAGLLAGPWRDTVNAATMLGQSKTAHQAEIDAACELTDFLRFNVEYMTQIYADQPQSSPGVWNRMEYRPLEGFVFAVSPFNFTAIAGNLTSSAALMGNVVLWKPASTAMLSAYYLMRLWQEAGLPDGVINMLPGSGATIGNTALGSRDLAGIHFTGSTPVFNGMWKTIGENAGRYRNYPRIVGETGGKDFIVAHPSAEVDSVAAAIVRGSFEYQGQKCSAASRVYAPANLWPSLRERLAEEVATIKVGDVADFGNFMGAVIDSSSFATQREAIEEARTHADTEIVVGGGYDDSRGFFVEPTVIETHDPEFRLLRDELFGPVVTTYVYDEKDWDGTLELIDESSPYGLTGAVFAEDRAAIQDAKDKLRYAAGNFYVNDKPTGAVVGQQPFGGSRASGTNDKAGSMWNLIRWVSPRSIKETFIPASDYRYPYLDTDDDRP